MPKFKVKDIRPNPYRKRPETTQVAELNLEGGA